MKGSFTCNGAKVIATVVEGKWESSCTIASKKAHQQQTRIPLEFCLHHWGEISSSLTSSLPDTPTLYQAGHW